MTDAGSMTGGGVRAEPLDILRLRTSEKWVSYPPDVLPLFVAEMDYPLAPAVAEAIVARVRASDTGYVASPAPVADAFAGFARRRWGWNVDPAGIRTTTDVSVAIVETLRQVLRPGDRVVITPPVYPPFFELIPEAGGGVVTVPLVDDGTGWAFDFEGLENAFADGARAMLLCNPQNPLGLVHSATTLARIADLAARFGVTVVSDEIHGPLTHTDAVFTPFLSVSDAAREHGIAVTGASKAFNLAGVKCALMIAASPSMTSILDAMPIEVLWRTSILGLHGSVAAFTDSDDWLDGVIRSIEQNRVLLGALLATQLPGVRYREPRASYLAWLDFRDLGWGDDPSIRALDVARVALNPGPSFGDLGRGFARLNLACSPDVLTEAVARLAAAR
jgi:cystathionine beta-lyase